MGADAPAPVALQYEGDADFATTIGLSGWYGTGFRHEHWDSPGLRVFFFPITRLGRSVVVPDRTVMVSWCQVLKLNLKYVISRHHHGVINRKEQHTPTVSTEHDPFILPPPLERAYGVNSGRTALAGFPPDGLSEVVTRGHSSGVTTISFLECHLTPNRVTICYLANRVPRRSYEVDGFELP